MLHNSHRLGRCSPHCSSLRSLWKPSETAKAVDVQRTVVLSLLAETSRPAPGIQLLPRFHYSRESSFRWASERTISVKPWKFRSGQFSSFLILERNNNWVWTSQGVLASAASYFLCTYSLHSFLSATFSQSQNAKTFQLLTSATALISPDAVIKFQVLYAEFEQASNVVFRCYTQGFTLASSATRDITRELLIYRGYLNEILLQKHHLGPKAICKRISAA